MHIENYKKEATNILKSELTRQGLTYVDLVAKLKAIGIEETQKSISMKIMRGSFSFEFFLQCMKALGKKEVRLFD